MILIQKCMPNGFVMKCMVNVFSKEQVKFLYEWMNENKPSNVLPNCHGLKAEIGIYLTGEILHDEKIWKNEADFPAFFYHELKIKNKKLIVESKRKNSV